MKRKDIFKAVLHLSVLCMLITAAAPVMASSDGFRYFGRLNATVETYKSVTGETAVPAYLYLNLTGIDPIDLGERTTLHLYGRISDDLTGEEDVESRLYLAYADVRGLFSVLDVRAGRQFVHTVAGSALTDGVDVRMEGVGGLLSFRVFGGGGVTFDDPYSSGDMVYGAAVDVVGHDPLVLGLSYFRKDEDSETVREALGLEAEYRFGSTARVYGETRYDMFSESTEYYLVGAKYRPTEALRLGAEYSYSVPVFDADDVYSVFAVDERKDLTVDAAYGVTGNFDVLGIYTREFAVDLKDTDIFEGGFEARNPGSSRVRASVLYGYGEDRWHGARLHAEIYPSEKTEFGGGAEYQAYERLGMQDMERASMAYLDGKYRFTRDVSAYLYLESMTGTVMGTENSALIKLTYDFRG